MKKRREQLLMKKTELADYTGTTRSFLSQVEAGKANASVCTLTKVARELDTTVADLFGDHATVRAAKATVFIPDECDQHLDQMQDTPTKRIIKHLTDCVRLGKTPSRALPPEPYYYYVSARICMDQGEFQEASELLQTGLNVARPLWRERLLCLLCLCSQECGDVETFEASKETLLDFCEYALTLDDIKAKAYKTLRVQGVDADLLDMIAGLEWAVDFIKMFEIINER